MAESEDFEPAPRRQCGRHNFEAAEHHCDSCAGDFCDACIVYPKGPRRPGYCIPCAMAKAGVSVRGLHPTRRPNY